MRQHSRLPFVATGLALLVSLGATAAGAEQAGLVQRLVGELGITEAQATGGAKAVFGLAKETLSTDEMGQLTAAVPEVATLLGGDVSAGSAVAAATAVGSAAGVIPAAGGAATGGASEALAAVTGAAAALSEPAASAEPGPAAEPLTAGQAADSALPATTGTTASTAAAALTGAAEGGLSLGAVAGMAGAAGADLGSLGALAGLTDSFTALGMDSSMVQRFVPVVLDYLGGKDAGTAALLKKGLGLATAM